MIISGIATRFKLKDYCHKVTLLADWKKFCGRYVDLTHRAAYLMLKLFSITSSPKKLGDDFH